MQGQTIIYPLQFPTATPRLSISSPVKAAGRQTNFATRLAHICTHRTTHLAHPLTFTTLLVRGGIPTSRVDVAVGFSETYTMQIHDPPLPFLRERRTFLLKVKPLSANPWYGCTGLPHQASLSPSWPEGGICI